MGADYFKGNVWGSQNVGNMADILVNNAISSGPPNLDGDGWGYAVFDGTQVIDKDAMAVLLVAGYKIRKGLYREAGYRYVETEMDTLISLLRQIRSGYNQWPGQFPSSIV